jgi:hypothetical protein
LSKSDAGRELIRLRRQWFAKRKGVVALLRETIFQHESPLVDSDAANKSPTPKALRSWGDEVALVRHCDRNVSTRSDRGEQKLRASNARYRRAVRHHSRNPEQRRCLALLASGPRLRQRRQPIVST